MVLFSLLQFKTHESCCFVGRYGYLMWLMYILEHIDNSQCIHIFENLWVYAMNSNAMVEYMNLPSRIIQTYGPSHSPRWKTWQVGDVRCAQLQCQCDVICPPDLSSVLWNNTVVSHSHCSYFACTIHWDHTIWCAHIGCSMFDFGLRQFSRSHGLIANA